MTYQLPTESTLLRAVQHGEASLQGNDLDFYRRVWTTDLDVYRTRLHAIRFTGMQCVLDAGAGFGQWTVCLSESNRQVHAIDYSLSRVNAVKTIVTDLGISNVAVDQQSIESLAFENQMFDGIFCYGVLFLTEFRSALREFARVLKPGGWLYISSNGIGWYLYNFLRPHNASRHFDPRRMATESMKHSLDFTLRRRRVPGMQLILPGTLLRRYLKSHGFERVILGGEGTINLGAEQAIAPFFASQYYGLEGVYEVLAQRAYDV